MKLSRSWKRENKNQVTFDIRLILKSDYYCTCTPKNLYFCTVICRMSLRLVKRRRVLEKVPLQ